MKVYYLISNLINSNILILAGTGVVKRYLINMAFLKFYKKPFLTILFRYESFTKK